MLFEVLTAFLGHKLSQIHFWNLPVITKGSLNGNLRGSVPPTRLRTTVLEGTLFFCCNLPPFFQLLYFECLISFSVIY